MKRNERKISVQIKKGKYFQKQKDRKNARRNERFGKRSKPERKKISY